MLLAVGLKWRRLVVTTDNSPSRGYTHPDDQTTNYATNYATSGLKPFTVLRSLGRQSERLANDHITYVSTVRRIRQLWFNHRCKDHSLVPARLKLKSPLNTQEAIQIVKATCRRLVKALINDSHRRLKCRNDKSTIKSALLHDSNLTKDEQHALKRLRNYKDIVILPADKRRVTVVIDKTDYHDKMDTLVNDKQTY